MKVQEKKNKLSGCHVVVVGDARAELLYCQYKPTDFLPFSLPLPSSLFKLPFFKANNGLHVVTCVLLFSS